MTDHRLSTSARLTQRLTDRRLDRRSVLSLGLGFGTLLTLTACTPHDSGSLAEGEPVRGGVLTYFEPQTWTLLYPPSVGFYPQRRDHEQHLRATAVAGSEDPRAPSVAGHRTAGDERRCHNLHIHHP